MEGEWTGKVRRAKLYYLRELRGKRARIRERREIQGASPEAPAEPAAGEEAEPQPEPSAEGQG